MKYSDAKGNICSHYMLATEVNEYSKDVYNYTGHRTMLKTTSWGLTIYIDCYEYREQRENKNYSSLLSIN